MNQRYQPPQGVIAIGACRPGILPAMNVTPEEWGQHLAHKIATDEEAGCAVQAVYRRLRELRAAEASSKPIEGEGSPCDARR